MQKLMILNTREIKKIKEKLKEQFGFEGKLNYAFLLNEKGRLFIINKDISRIDLDKLKIDKYGLYFGEMKREEIRLSMEGAWLVGKEARKNLVELDEKEVKNYFLGFDLKKKLELERAFVLLKFKEEVIGCARYKEGKILNFLPKTHRSKDLII